jgi:hypothetical protein
MKVIYNGREIEVRTRKPLRLGTRVARIAQPIARAIDKVLGTNVRKCGGCKKRRKKWNRLL